MFIYFIFIFIFIYSVFGLSILGCRASFREQGISSARGILMDAKQSSGCKSRIRALYDVRQDTLGFLAD